MWNRLFSSLCDVFLRSTINSLFLSNLLLKLLLMACSGIHTLQSSIGPGSDHTAFLFRLLHQLLPTQDWVQIIIREQQEQPGRCQLCQIDVENLLHAFFLCNKSMVAGHALLGYAQQCIPDLTPEAVLRLELGPALDDVDQLAVVSLLATGLMYIWKMRAEKKVLAVSV